MLIFPLKKVWFEKIESGEKCIEYRKRKPYWETRLYNEGVVVTKNIPYDYVKLQKQLNCFLFPAKCFFQLGYTKKRLEATITRVEIVDGKNTDLQCEGDVFAIHFYLNGLQEKKIQGQ